MTFKPWLPKHWQDIRFALKWQGNKIAVAISHDACRFRLSAPTGATEVIEVFGRPVTLNAGQETVFALEPA